MATAAGGCLLAPAASGAAAPDDLGAKARTQIAALQQLKRSLTPAERKLDGRLVFALRLRRDPAAGTATPYLAARAPTAEDAQVEVDVRARAVDADLLRRLTALGARIRHASAREASVRAAVPLGALAEVASFKDVRRVDDAVASMTARIGAPALSESKQAGAARLDAQLRAALAPDAEAPTVVSEGDRTHAADSARARFRVTGVGVKVCVLSNGVDSLAAKRAAGELPDVDVLPGQAGQGDEGTAMLEIVHDVAPKAALGFATYFPSAEALADNIRALRRDAGCDVLVDDVLYVDEAPFQDGPIARAVDDVVGAGALYFSAAGNFGNTLDGTSANFEGDFVDSGRPVRKFRGSAHDFDPGPGVQIFQPLSDQSGAWVPVTLFWANPLGAAADDYDLYLLDAADNLVAFSQDVQDGDDDPFEWLYAPPSGASGLRLAVVRFAGAARYFQLSALGGRFANSADGLVARVTPGVIRGHSAAAGAFSVGAAPAADPLPQPLEPGDPANPAGPFPNPFTAAQRPERFTSDGPRRVFFEPDGTPITPGNFTSTGGRARAKPDVLAADGVSTSVFAPFFGTSAAAPHAAALAALVASGNPGATTEDVREAFASTALDVAPAGPDARAGFGLLRADQVLPFTGATPQPLVTAAQPAVTPEGGDGDGFLESGERATLALAVTNVGDGSASGVSVRVTTADAQASVSPRTRSYGDLASGATRSGSFTLALADDRPVGKPVALSVRVTFAGALSPTSRTLTILTGEPAAGTTTFAYAGPPVAIPDATDVGASVAIPVSGIAYASQLTFSIDGASCTTTAGAATVGVDHTFVGDLEGTLTAPDGRSATLFSRAGGAGNNLCQVTFDDAAPRPFSEAPQDDAPFTGSWRPDDPLAAFLSAPISGTWTFTVRDAAGADTGSIRAVSLHVRGFAGA